MNNPLSRRRFICAMLCALSLFSASVFAQSSAARIDAKQTAPLNLDFEQGSVGRVPEGWTAPAVITGYAAELVEDRPRSGKRAALLKSVPDDKPRQFGNLMQAVDATPYRGHRVRYRAAVRLEGAGPRASALLWLRADRPGNQMGFFQNMEDRPITSGEWQYYEIVGDIDDDALVLNFGLLLTGEGKAWIDDVSVDDLGKLTVMAEPARPLTRRGLENLVAFARLVGYVRHFHPSDEAMAADWNATAIEGVRFIEEAKDARELAERLQTFFSPLAPTLRVYPNGKTPAALSLMPPNETALKIVSYRHTGFGQKNANQYNPYRTERPGVDAPQGKAPENSPDPQKPFSADLGGGVTCLLPLALYADARGTWPRASAPQKTAAAGLVKYSGNDRATRLAGVMLAWNIFQHFYPYFDVVKTDWPRVLNDALTSAATDTDEKAFLTTLRRLVAALQDGHGGVYHESLTGGYALPVIFGWVENRLVITAIAQERAGGLQPGDVVLKVNGKDALEALSEMESLISGATPQWRRFNALFRLRLGDKDSEVKLDVQPRAGTTTRTLVLKRDAESLSLKETRPQPVSEIKPGIFYLDLDRIKDEDYKAVMPQLEKATGIIFDLRGYPSVSPDLITHLIDKPIESARWMIPIITMPDRKEPISYNESGRWKLEPAAPRFKAKLAFITDGRAISYAESYMGIIEAYKLAEIVGETTAGTNGNINPFTLPGGYRVVWTGMRVLKHDGSQHHGIGIRPTVPVQRTIRGIIEGRDEQLERAIAVVSQ